MKPFRAIELRWLVLFSLLTVAVAQAQVGSENCTLVGRWTEGECYDVIADGNRVYLGNGACLQIMDYNDPVHPLLLGRIVLPMMVRGVASRDNKIYVADQEAGLRIVDVTDPAAPVEIGALEGIGTVNDVVLAGSHAFIAAGNYGLIIADISNPALPVGVGKCLLPGAVNSVAVNGQYAYAVAWNNFTVVDITNPAMPAAIAQRLLPDVVMEVTIHNNHAYLACSNGGLRIFDISTPAQPVEVGFCLENRQIFSVQLVNSTAYIASYESGLFIYDVSTPSHPVKVDSLRNVPYIRRIAMRNDLAFVACSSMGMSAISIPPSSPPNVLSTLKTGSYWRGLDVEEDYAYLSGGETLRIINCADPGSPFSEGYLASGNYDCDKVVAQNNHAYLAASYLGLAIVDVSSPAHPLLSATTNSFDWSKGLAVEGHFAYLADYTRGLRIVDITNPLAPAEIGSFDTPGKACDVTVESPYAFVADEDSGLCIVNIADPAHPAFVVQIKSSSYTMASAVREQTLFVAGGDSIRVYNITQIGSPQQIGGCPARGFARQIELAGNYAFLAAGMGGVVIFDISDLQTPQPVSYYITGGEVYDIAVKDSLIYALDGETGLYILRLNPPAQVEKEQTGSAPADFALLPGYPNPFNNSTTMEYTLDRPEEVEIEVYNLLGEPVATLQRGHREAGRHRVVWSGNDSSGRQVPSGIYFVRMRAREFTANCKLLLLR